MAKLVNASLASARFPVSPILKKPSVDPTQLTSYYTPISNLSFTSKLLERTISSQVAAFFNQNKLFPPLQSAYRPRHSTETALIKIMNDALLAADPGMVTLVVLLDYSAAFDTMEWHGP